MASNFKIQPNGIWENQTGYGHHFDEGIYKATLKFLKEKEIKTIVDFGCGKADYIKKFIKEGYYCEAYDGNPHTPELTSGVGTILDLSKEFDLNKKFDLVLSLEVGEHIPKEYEEIYLDNLCKHSNKHVLLSWAIIGQTGDGHINCQNNDYIINEMFKRGFEYDLKNSLTLRQNVSNAFWFKNTIMIFLKK
jgi:SAM-dependent methyltransferase